MSNDSIHSIGVDIVEVERVRVILARHHDRFLARVFTPQEVRDCGDRVNSLAVRWAAKEAVSKALGSGWEGIRWTDIEIVRLARGRPGVVLHGRARTEAERLGLDHWMISLSHSAAYAVAFVIASAAGAHRE